MAIFTDNQLLERQSMVCFFDFHISVTSVAMGVLKTCTFVKTYNAIHERKMVLSSKPDINTTTGTFAISHRETSQTRQNTVHGLHSACNGEMHSSEILNGAQTKGAFPMD